MRILLDNISLTLHLLFHMITFLGGLQIALYNRSLPHWIVTSLWYIGLSSAFVSLTMAMQFAYGEEFPMSYNNIGDIADLVNHGMIAMTIISLFMHTTWKNKYLNGVHDE